MKFKKQLFGFMDMLRFKQLVSKRREALAQGSNAPLPTTYRTNELAKKLHPGYMKVKLTAINRLTPNMNEFVFERLDSDSFPFFRAGQYVSLQASIGSSLASRPYSIVSSPNDALKNKLVLAIENCGFFSGYMMTQVKVGDEFIMSEPSGEFHYETLRDHKQIVCIAGGSGITPFISMAKSMIEKNEEYEMILFYGAKDLEHLAYYETLKQFESQGLKVVYVLSEENIDNFEYGFITKELITKYCDLNKCSIFMCGPVKMYDFIDQELASLNLPLKAVHRDASCCQDLAISEPKIFDLVVHMRDKTYNIKAKENETILVAMERAKLNAPNKCRAGGCGFCHSKLIKGQYYVSDQRNKVREADIKFGFIHPCVSYPKSDLEIEVPVAY